jgi:hypothetical protein
MTNGLLTLGSVAEAQRRGAERSLRHPANRARCSELGLRCSEMAASVGFPDQANKIPDDLI